MLYANNNKILYYVSRCVQPIFFSVTMHEFCNWHILLGAKTMYYCKRVVDYYEDLWDVAYGVLSFDTLIECLGLSQVFLRATLTLFFTHKNILHWY